MSQDFIKDFSKKLEQEVLIKGWVYNFRSSGKIAFLQVRDGSGFCQAIALPDSMDKKSWQTVEEITLESSVEIIGVVSKHPKKDEYELQIKEIKLIQKAEEYPIGKKEHGPDFLLDKRHLWLRSESQWAVLRIRHLVKVGLQEYFNQNGFIELDTPTFTPTSCEGTTDLFEVNYFDRKAYLTQNGQLYLEAMCMAFGKVYDLCPNFRAEKSKTRKHLTEFWTLNPEIAFIGHEESLKIQEEALKYVVKYVLENGARELTALERNVQVLKNFVEEKFIHYTYDEAIIKLNELGSNIKHGDDLGADEEELLTKDSDAAVVVKQWPKKIKPFYMKENPENNKQVLNADILAPRGFGEIVGGSEREDNLKIISANIKSAGLSAETFDWYLDLRRFGSVPHCGFGIGIERLIRFVSGIHHVRETIPFPRMINRINP